MKTDSMMIRRRVSQYPPAEPKRRVTLRKTWELTVVAMYPIFLGLRELIGYSFR